LLPVQTIDSELKRNISIQLNGANFVTNLLKLRICSYYSSEDTLFCILGSNKRKLTLVSSETSCVFEQQHGYYSLFAVVD
jgi:hypothetical protein